MTRLLVLRPEPGNGETVRRARERGLDAVAMPLFAIEAVGWKPPNPARFDGLLLTSANAVRKAGDGLARLRGLRVHAVGDATAEAAREAGFDIASSGEAGVDRLLGSIEPHLRLLHLCGEDRAAPDQASQDITPVTVYRARMLPPPDLASIDGAIALVHSARAGKRIAALVRDPGTIAVAAISESAAAAAGNGWRAVGVAERACDYALLDAAARLCDTAAAT